MKKNILFLNSLVLITLPSCRRTERHPYYWRYTPERTAEQYSNSEQLTSSKKVPVAARSIVNKQNKQLAQVPVKNSITQQTTTSVA